MKKVILFLFSMLSMAFADLSYGSTISIATFSGATYCVGQSVTISYTATGSFTAGPGLFNVFILELSNASGSFTNPYYIGIVRSDVSGTLTGYVPSNVPAGAGYRVRVVSSDPLAVSNDNGANIAVSACSPSSILNLNFLIEGYSLGSSLQSALYNQLIYPGGYYTVNDVDYATIELHSATSPNAVVTNGTYVGILQTDGSLKCTFPNLSTGNYYIVVKTHNTLETWSSSAVAFTSGGTTNYDFTSGAGQAYGNNMASGNLIFSGDIGDNNSTTDKHDGAIDGFDYVSQRADIDAGNYGYFKTDLNGDGNVDLLDFPLIDNNNYMGIGITRPNFVPSSPAGPFPPAVYNTYLKNVTASSSTITFEIWVEQINGTLPHHKIDFYQAGIDFIDYNAFRNGGNLTGAMLFTGAGVSGGNLDAVSHQIRIIGGIYFADEASAPLLPYQSAGGYRAAQFEITNSGSFTPALISDVVANPQNYFAWSFDYGTAYTTRSGLALFSTLADYTNPGQHHIGNNVEAPIPTLSEWGLILLGGLLVVFGAMYVRKIT